MTLAALPNLRSNLRRRLFNLATLSLGGLAFAHTAMAAPIASPSQTAHKSQNRVAVLEAVAPAEGDSYRFTTVERLSSQSLSADIPAEITLGLQGFDAGSLEAGNSYLVVFSDLLKVALASNTFKKDPEGYKALHFALVGPAILADTPALRKVFRKAPKGEANTAAQIDSVLDLFADQDSRVRTIGALELQYRLGLWPEFNEQQIDRLGKALAKASGAPEQQLGLLVAGRGIATQQSKAPSWLRPRALDILKAISSDLDFDTAEPALATEALSVLAEIGKGADLNLAEKHMASKHPAVGRQAVEAFLALAGDKTEKRARKMLVAGDLTADAEQLLRARLRRMEREEEQKKSGGL